MGNPCGGITPPPGLKLTEYGLGGWEWSIHFFCSGMGDRNCTNWLPFARHGRPWLPAERMSRAHPFFYVNRVSAGKARVKY